MGFFTKQSPYPYCKDIHFQKLYPLEFHQNSYHPLKIPGGGTDFFWKSPMIVPIYAKGSVV